MKLNPVLLEEDRHRRMNVLVGAVDFESALTQRRRHGAHFWSAVFTNVSFTSSREVRQQEKTSEGECCHPSESPLVSSPPKCISPSYCNQPQAYYDRR
jgi:hypothetical protein